MAKEKNHQQSLQDKCEKYGLAITDYILDEEMDIPASDLFNHLAACEHCRKDLANWRQTYAALRNQAYFNKPEVQKKYQQMLESIKKGDSCLPPPLSQDEQLINTDWDIGHFAGELHKFLGQSGKISLDEVIKKTGFNKTLLDRLIGWLASERKICLTRDNKTEYVYLKPHEQKLYRQENRPQA